MVNRTFLTGKFFLVAICAYMPAKELPRDRESNTKRGRERERERKSERAKERESHEIR